MNIYGIPRMTADIDFLLDFDLQNVELFQAIMEQFGYTPTIPIDLKELAELGKRKYYLEERNLVAYSFVSLQADAMSMDVLVDCPIDFHSLWERKETRQLQDYAMYIVSLEDLIAMKEYANRAQDRSDILLLSKLLEK